MSGLAGSALVNTLLMAHPSSFSPLSSVNYIAYTVIGGKASMLGSVVGCGLLVWASDLFALKGEYSQFLFGLLLVVTVLAVREGIVGAFSQFLRRVAAVRARSGAAPVRLSPTATEERS